MQNLVVPSFFGTRVTGDAQGDELGRMIPALSMLATSSSIILRFVRGAL